MSFRVLFVGRIAAGLTTAAHAQIVAARPVKA